MLVCMTSKRKHTTKAQDAAFILSRLTDAHRAWKVGDTCLSYNGSTTTTVASIEAGPNGNIIHLANGDHMHCSHMRSAK